MHYCVLFFMIEFEQHGEKFNKIYVTFRHYLLERSDTICEKAASPQSIAHFSHTKYRTLVKSIKGKLLKQIALNNIAQECEVI